MSNKAPAWIGYAAGTMLGIGLLSGILLLVDSKGSLGAIALGLVVMVLSLGLYATLQALLALTSGSGAGASASESAMYHGLEHNLEKMLKEQNEMMKQLVEAAWLTDAAKSIAFRSKDLDALRKAIHEDLELMEFERAYYLVDEMERRFGYRQEAESLRGEIDRTRQNIVDRKVEEAVDNFEKQLALHEWAKAKNEYERLARIFPAHPKVRTMPERIEASRNQYKSRLIKDFKAAADRSETDKAMEILKELDKYLTPKEAESYADMARGVIKERQATLQTRFSLARTTQDWKLALETASEIIVEFPHAKMAEEAREVLPKLRELAGVPA